MIINIFFMKIIEVLTLMYGCYSLRNLQFPFKLLVYYIGFSTIVGTIACTVSNIYHNNLIVIQLYTPLEFVFIVAIIVQLSKWNKSTTHQISLIYLLIWFLLFKWLGVSDNLDEIPSTLANTIIFILSTIVLLKINLDSNKSFLNNPEMITLLGFMIYFGCNVFVFIMANAIFKEGNSNGILLWSIHNILHIILNLSFVYSFYLINKSMKDV